MLVGWSELVDQSIAVCNSDLGDYVPMGIQLLEIIWINILLSGDNAVVIALACRSLPGRQRTLGILLGSGAAVALRVVFTVFVVEMLGLPFVKIAGGVLLVWIAIKLAYE